MKIYLVGGAIRDELLGLPVKEKDWVVVGASPEALLAEGFQPVGKDFPVFLHPETHEEYALARTERKVGKGYKGFTFHTEPNVKLEEDLKRRDLTVNAMARDDDGNIFDPYKGQDDLKAKILRHISPAFSEDPVRILRVARFSSKLPDFTVDSETNHLMQTMVNNGEINALVSERVWQEFSRALLETQPIRFFEVLNDCDALAVLFPMLHLNSRGMLALNRAVALNKLAPVRFAALLHDIDCGVLAELVQRYRIPKEFSELANLSCQHTQTYADTLMADAKTMLQFIKRSDALRRPNRFQLFLNACHACIDDDQNQRRDQHIMRAINAIQQIDIAPLQEQGIKGKDFADALEKLQITAIETIRAS